jgi:hypothetical protein
MHRLALPPLLALALALHLISSPASSADRSLVTDEPVFAKGRPEGAAEYGAKEEAADGQHLALTMQKLQQGLDRPFLI